jgi:hypothetical protein
VATSGDKVKLYDAGGKRAGEIDKSQVVGRDVDACDDTYGIIKITLADKREVWIDRNEAKPTDGSDGKTARSEVCVTQERSNDPTNEHLASNGVQSESCSVKR